MEKGQIFNILKLVAICGNVVYILWILWNGIDESFSGTIVQIISYIGLIVLLILNILLLYRKK